MRERYKLTNNIPDRQIQLGETVIIEEKHIPRCRWKIGKVEEFWKSKDGFNRGCKLRLVGKKGSYFIRRPVNKLYPLEIRETLKDNVTKNNEMQDVAVVELSNRPRRIAADTGTLVRRLQNQK